MSDSGQSDFLWTSASSDDSDSSNEDSVPHKQMNGINTSESESGKHSKKKLHKKLNISTNENDTTIVAEAASNKRKRKKDHEENSDQPETKHVKTELESTDRSKKKKKKNRENVSISEMEFDNSQVEESQAEDESYLNLRVKQEAISNVQQSPEEEHKEKKKKIKKKHKERKSSTVRELSYSDTTDEANIHKEIAEGDMNHTECERNGSESPVEKKKNKKRHQSGSEDVKVYNNMRIEDEFSAEETVVERRAPSPSPAPAPAPAPARVDNGHVHYSSDEDEPADTASTPKPASNTTRKKLSENIVFEEESTAGSALRRYLSSRAELRPAPAPSPSPSPSPAGFTLGADDEAWSVHVPREVSPRALRHVELAEAAGGACRLRAGSARYCGALGPPASIALLTAHARLDHVAINGAISFRKKLPELLLPDDVTVAEEVDAFIPLPDVKPRHPLFGADFKRAMKIPKEVSARLKEASVKRLEDDTGPEEEAPVKKKKKKYKREEVEEPEVEVKWKHKEKKAKKRSREESAGEAGGRGGKRRRHAWDDERSIEENLFTY